MTTVKRKFEWIAGQSAEEPERAELGRWSQVWVKVSQTPHILVGPVRPYSSTTGPDQTFSLDRARRPAASTWTSQIACFAEHRILTPPPRPPGGDRRQDPTEKIRLDRAGLDPVQDELRSLDGVPPLPLSVQREPYAR